MATTKTLASDTLRIKAAWFTFDQEARRDKQGRLKIYPLPAADGGGSFEVAGINDHYHGPMAHRLADLIREGKHDQAERDAILYIAQYCDPAAMWGGGNAGVEAFLRDCVFNRGPKGAVRILQRALGVAHDGKFGPVSARALSERVKTPDRLLYALRSARENYERAIAPPVGDRAKLWKGLVNRWDAAEAFASKLLA